MNSKHLIRALILTALFLVAAPALWPQDSYAQTEGMERRGDRRGDRGEARDVRQEGRGAARDAKAVCKEGDSSRAECRQEKRGMKQDAREGARDVKTND